MCMCVCVFAKKTLILFVIFPLLSLTLFRSHIQFNVFDFFLTSLFRDDLILDLYLQQ